MRELAGRNMRLLILLCLLTEFSLAQNISDFIRIKTDGVTGEVLNVRVYKNNTLSWSFYPDSGKESWSYEYLYNNNKELIAIRKYINGRINSIDSLRLDSGEPINYIDLSEHDHCRGVECIYDEKNRIKEIKGYKPTGIRRKKKLDFWHKYTYIPVHGPTMRLH